MQALRCRVAGFSIVELVMVLSILSILALWIVPSMSSALDSMRVRSTSETFLTSMQLARNTAVIKSQHVVLCKSSDGLICQTEGGWEQGWIIFQDTNRNESPRVSWRPVVLSQTDMKA
jgi:type IV fimbrial biogenesis protein FimT